MTYKTTRFFITKRTRSGIEGLRREVVFEMGDIMSFCYYKHSEKLIVLYFYNGTVMLIENSFTDILIAYEKSRLSNYTNLN